MEIEDLSYFVEIQKNKQKCLLKSITTSFEKSVVTVLMGHSGAGKTTLMDLIAGRKLSGIYCGNISIIEDINEQNIINNKSKIAYVQSTDIHIGEFTIQENLYYASKLKYGDVKSNDECLKLCIDVATSLQLDNALNVPVGTALIKGISGGQKKRLSIAIELLNVPSILCLDEPTSGLDSSTSLQIAQTLSNLTKSSKTIICTVHQPSMDMLEIWENIVLLSNGRLIYSGKIKQLHNYLNNNGFRTCNQNQNFIVNPVEYTLELLANPIHTQSLINTWISHQKNSQNILTNIQTINSTSISTTITTNTTTILTKNENNNNYYNIISNFILNLLTTVTWNHIKTLSSRQSLYLWKSIHGLTVMLIRNIIGGVIFGILYYRNGYYLSNEKNIIDFQAGFFTPYCSNMQSLQFTTVIFLIAINSIAVPSMNLLSLLYHREQSSNLYSPLAYWIATFVIDIILLLFGSSIFAIMVKMIADIYGPKEIFYPIVLLSACLGYSQAKLCALLCKNSQSAFVIYALLACAEMILSGFLILPDAAPSYLQWTLDITFSRWAISGLIYNQFNNFKENGDLSKRILNNQGEIILKYYDLQSFKTTKCLIILIVYLIGLELLVIYALLPKRSKLIHVSSITDPKINWNVGEIEEQADTESLQIDLIPNKENIESFHSLSSSIFTRSSIQNFITQSSISIFEPYDEVQISSSQQQLSYSDGRLTSNKTYTEPENIYNIANKLDSTKQVQLLFKDISYTIPSKDNRDIILLKQISGIVRPGEMCAIMGSSGAGKTTLLNVLYGRANTGVITGSITLNGIPINNYTSSLTERPTCAYVTQDDVHIPVLTVKETLTYAAMLRLRDSNPNSKRIQEAVNDTIDLLGLKHISESYIGTAEKRFISLGQLRRVTIGVEIVNQPSLIFLDEPTSGLDSFLASSVIDGLSMICESKRTICCTIHQPSITVFNRFHKLLLLSDGYPLYFGPISNCRHHFENYGFFINLPNPAEYVITVATILSSKTKEKEEKEKKEQKEQKEKKEEIESPKNDQLNLIACSKYYMDSLSRIDREDIQNFLPLNPSSNLPTPSIVENIFQEFISNWNIFIILVEREVIGIIRRKFWVSILLRSTLIGIFLGLLWSKSDDYLSRISFFFASFVATCVWVIEVVPGIHEEKLIFYRERAAKATTTFTSWLAMGLTMSIMSFFICLVYTIPAYFIAGLRGNIKHFLIFLLTLYLGVIIHILLQYLTAGITPNPMLHTLIFPGLVIPYEALFCGYVVNISRMYSWYSWLTDINPLRWYLNALFTNELKGNSSALGSVKFEDLQELFGWKSSISFCIYIMISIILILKVLSYFVFRFVDHSSA